MLLGKREVLAGPVRSGEWLRVSVFELETPGKMFVSGFRVGEDGAIVVPPLGVLKVEAATVKEVEQRIGAIAVEKKLLLAAGAGAAGPQVEVLRVAEGDASTQPRAERVTDERMPAMLIPLAPR